MFGLSDKDFTFIVQTLVNPIQAQGGKVFCFGSRAREDNKKFSDLDLLIRGDDSLKPLLFKIQETLEESNFPYKVDIVFEKELAESYRENVEKELRTFTC